jgi:hypothetical protein
MQLTPDVRAARIESYGQAYDLLLEALAKYPRDMWKYRAPHDPWTIYDQIIHITDSEANSFVRCRRFIAEPGSKVMGYDQDIWTASLYYLEQSAEEALDLFRALRRNSYNLIKRLPDSVWSNTVEHSENGTMTFDDWLVVYDEHVPGHIRQMDAIYEAWRKTQT